MNQDSGDDGEYCGEQKETAKKVQELRAAEHWMNQKCWDTAGEGRAVSPTTGEEIDLRLDWSDAKRRLQQGRL